MNVQGVCCQAVLTQGQSPTAVLDKLQINHIKGRASSEKPRAPIGAVVDWQQGSNKFGLTHF
jgi:hypothetical protein